MKLLIRMSIILASGELLGRTTLCVDNRVQPAGELELDVAQLCEDLLHLTDLRLDLVDDRLAGGIKGGDEWDQPGLTVLNEPLGALDVGGNLAALNGQVVNVDQDRRVADVVVAAAELRLASARQQLTSKPRGAPYAL